MRLVLLILLAGALTACGVPLPNDPYGTLERVRGGELRVGLVLAPEGVRAERSRVDGFAERLDAAVVYHQADAHALITELERGQLDLVAALPRKTPFKDAGFTRAFFGPDGDERVWAVRSGENAFLLEANRYLYERDTPS